MYEAVDYLSRCMAYLTSCFGCFELSISSITQFNRTLSLSFRLYGYQFLSSAGQKLSFNFRQKMQTITIQKRNFLFLIHSLFIYTCELWTRSEQFFLLFWYIFVNSVQCEDNESYKYHKYAFFTCMMSFWVFSATFKILFIM